MLLTGWEWLANMEGKPDHMGMMERAVWLIISNHQVLILCVSFHTFESYKPYNVTRSGPLRPKSIFFKIELLTQNHLIHTLRSTLVQTPAKIKSPKVLIYLQERTNTYL